ncbi:Cryparin [Cladobotryum mycophilum]|uniref:Cryparin n=1 Tax=Cladobotryum mycophilum TaxID=491253 RepID=A0ABR0SH53_9HYPO
MQFFTIIALFFAASASAAPATQSNELFVREEGQGNSFCPTGLYANPQCCKVNALGVASLDCVNPPEGPNKCKSFQAVCAKISRQPQCCVLPVAGQAVLCQKPVGAK